MLDIIAYVPTQEITIGFLNAKQKIKLSHQGKTIEQFQVDAHAAVVQAFSSIDVKYKTPTHRELSKAFAEASRHSSPTMHYFMTDGVPSDQPVEAVASLIQNRAEPHKNPLTLMSCTNEDQEVEWMKEVIVKNIIFTVFELVSLIRLKSQLHLYQNLMILTMKNKKLLVIKVPLFLSQKDFGWSVNWSLPLTLMILMLLTKTFPSQNIHWTIC